VSSVSFDPVESDLVRFIQEQGTDGVDELFVGFGLPFAGNDINGPLAVSVDFDARVVVELSINQSLCYGSEFTGVIRAHTCT
jgi:hypothetical protein